MLSFRPSLALPHLKAMTAPEMVNSLVCDKITSLTAAEAIVAALFQAERSGNGQKVDISMLDAALSFLWPDTMNNFTFLEPDVEQVPYLGSIRSSCIKQKTVGSPPCLCKTLNSSGRSAPGSGTSG